MSLREELGFLRPIEHKAHEALLGIVLTGALLAKEGGRILRPFGLTDAQFNVLILLANQSAEGRINQTSLGNMLLVNRANITGLIDRMEKAGLVRRVADPDDRRVNPVEMTDTGRQALKKAQVAYFERLDEVMSVLSPEEYKTLSGMMERVRKQLRDKRKN